MHQVMKVGASKVEGSLNVYHMHMHWHVMQKNNTGKYILASRVDRLLTDSEISLIMNEHYHNQNIQYNHSKSEYQHIKESPTHSLEISLHDTYTHEQGTVCINTLT